LPALDDFITNKEEHLKELRRLISQTETVKALSRENVEGCLGTPLNQYFTIKRFIEDWGTLTELLDSDNSNMGKLVTVFGNSCNARKKLGGSSRWFLLRPCPLGNWTTQLYSTVRPTVENVTENTLQTVGICFVFHWTENILKTKRCENETPR